MNFTKKHLANGFTLIELMAVIAIIGITLGIGLPSFQANFASGRLTASADTMLTALQMARSEAIKQNKLAGVTFNANGQSWDAVIFGIPNMVLQSYTAAANVTLVVTSGDTLVSYRPEGRLSSAAPIVMVLSAAGSNDYRKITVQPSGALVVENPDDPS